VPTITPHSSIYEKQTIFICHILFYLVPERKRDFSSSSRQIKILTTGIHRVFRGLKLLFNEEIGGKGHFRSGTI